MKPQRVYQIIEELALLLEPSTAHKLRVMFGHLAQRERPIHGLQEAAARDWLMTAATLIDQYQLIENDFNAEQRALLVLEIEEAQHAERAKRLQ